MNLNQFSHIYNFIITLIFGIISLYIIAVSIIKIKKNQKSIKSGLSKS